ncbi:MAG: CPBP family intramembrane metalloprotease [Methylacidiphilales bacterium]|nr:CPBP family intramembrane metalloprotease [Candidatus Methylacidiphilales bacterium]MDW8349027.1 type II CAAX endopeptidase family protein [Verrucomicrobiae bacterium]
MSWLSENEWRATQAVAPWFIFLFLSAILLFLITAKPWTALLKSLKCEGGKVTPLSRPLPFICAIGTWLVIAQLESFETTIMLIGSLLLVPLTLGTGEILRLGWWPSPLRFIFHYILLGLGTVFILWLLHASLTYLWFLAKWPFHEQPAVKIFLQTQGLVPILVFVLQACFIAPLIEEFFFRGTLYPLLKTFSHPLIAAFVTSLIFAWIHFYWVGFLPLFLLGLLLTAAYERTGSVWASIGIHIGFNTLNIIALLILKAGIEQLS